MKLLPLLLPLSLLFSNSLYASDFIKKTSACRMEVKIVGPDVLEKDKNYEWFIAAR